MEDLNKEYKEILKERDTINSEIEQIKKEAMVIKYINYLEKKKELVAKTDELYKKLLIKKYSNCDHILVMSDYEYDSWEGRSYRYYGCVKCGLNEAVAERGYGRNIEEIVMLDLMN